ncbi:MAG: hypothetical protein NZ874_02145 [Fimbriimonadales bacterium]|nr:hypothetical protein [Fimbriimonadales bacterium]
MACWRGGFGRGVLLAGIFALCLSACQRRAEMRVRIDLQRAAQALTLPLPPSPPSRLPAAQSMFRAESWQLALVESPPPTETLSQRRQLALLSIEQQRDAVRQNLLQARLRNLPELEQRWRTELRAQYDLESLRAERDAEWQEAFQQYGQRRFPLLVERVLAAPESEAQRDAQARIDRLDREWQAREQAIEAQYRARQERVEQEIQVRLNARKREFIRNAELEVREQLAQQPNPAELYLPQPQTQPSAPARHQPVPAMTARFPARRLDASLRARRAHGEQVRLQILTQLAREWAQIHGYTLTDDARAPDKTDAFVRYLLDR